jgi:hypothetical protein
LVQEQENEGKANDIIAASSERLSDSTSAESKRLTPIQIAKLIERLLEADKKAEERANERDETLKALLAAEQAKTKHFETIATQLQALVGRLSTEREIQENTSQKE